MRLVHAGHDIALSGQSRRVDYGVVTFPRVDHVVDTEEQVAVCKPLCQCELANRFGLFTMVFSSTEASTLSGTLSSSAQR